MTREEIFAEISAERERQEKKFPNQEIPVVCAVLTGRAGGCDEQRMAEEYEIPTQVRAKFLTDTADERRQLTWAHVLVEELAEFVGDATAFSGSPPRDEMVRKEALQLAACCVRFIEYLDAGRVK